MFLGFSRANRQTNNLFVTMYFIVYVFLFVVATFSCGVSEIRKTEPRVLPDADADAGAPKCMVQATPEEGSPTTAFDFAFSSDGSTCTWKIDEIDMGPVACIGTVASNYFFAGQHTITLTSNGPGGSSECKSSTINVIGDQIAADPDCGITLAPSEGTPETPFYVTTSSTATDCGWALDGVDQGPISCNATSTELFLPLGSHKVSLTTGGFAKPKSCESTPAIVTPASSPELPTCSLATTPSVGTPATVYEASWSASGTACALSLDGKNLGTVDCNAARSFAGQSEGTHTIKLRTTNAGGSTICTSTFTVSATGSKPICLLVMTPPFGTINDTFRATWSASGETCRLELDGVDLGLKPCNTATDFLNQPVGAHMVILRTKSPFGTNECVTSFHVSE